MGALALTSTDLRVFEDGPRVKDLRLAEVLGFDRPRDIRKVIQRNLSRLERHGMVCAIVAQTSDKGGRPALEYWLNERQGYRLCMWSEAPNADVVQEQMADVFYPHRHGELVQLNPTLESMQRQIDEMQTVIAMFVTGQSSSFQQALPIHPKLFPYHRADGAVRRQARPRWWHDEAKRAWMLENYRIGTIDQAVARATDLFGEGAICRSAIGRFWKNFDDIVRAH